MMNYLDQIPLNYLLITIGLTLTLIIYALAKFVPVREGIFPQFWKLMGKFSDYVSGEIELIGHFLFGVLEDHVDEFFANERSLRSIAKLLKVAAVFIMLVTFYASFNSITEFFVTLGFHNNVAITLALANDAFIGLAVIYRLYHSFKGESSMSGSMALFFFTALSFYFNIRHIYQGNASPWGDLTTAGSLAPLGLFVSIEFLSSVIKSQTYREGAVRTDQQLGDEVLAKRQEIEDLKSQIEEAAQIRDQEQALNVRVLELQADIKHLEEVIHELDKRFLDKVPNGEGRLDQVRLLANNGSDALEIAKTLNISEKTARSYYRTATNGVSE